MRPVLIPLAPPPPTPAPPQARVVRLDGTSMGTTWRASLVIPAQRPAAPLRDAIEAELARVVAQMSHWEPDSDLSRFNRAPAATGVGLPDALFQVLVTAQEIAAASDGACDVTTGELVALWGFGAGHAYREPTFRPPDDAAIAAARGRAGWRRLVLDAGDGTALQPGGLCLDLSAIAKGFAVDQVARRLSRDGVASHLVEIGGELRGTGTKPDGQPWWVAVEVPDDLPPRAAEEGSAAGTDEADEADQADDADEAAEADDPLIALAGQSIATSGDYLRCFRQDGMRHAHTIDPRTGRPVTHAVATVTVLHPDCVRADALATALMVAGTRGGLAWADRHDVAARFVVRHARGLRARRSRAWRAMEQ